MKSGEKREDDRRFIGSSAHIIENWFLKHWSYVMEKYMQEYMLYDYITELD